MSENYEAPKKKKLGSHSHKDFALHKDLHPPEVFPIWDRTVKQIYTPFIRHGSDEKKLATGTVGELHWAENSMRLLIWIVEEPSRGTRL